MAGLMLADIGDVLPIPNQQGGSIMLPLKGSMAHLDGQELSEEQARMTRLAPGVRPALLVKQMMAKIYTRSLDMEDANLRALLAQLRAMLAALDLEVVNATIAPRLAEATVALS
jgi:hypothetical protein